MDIGSFALALVQIVMTFLLLLIAIFLMCFGIKNIRKAEQENIKNNTEKVTVKVKDGVNTIRNFFSSKFGHGALLYILGYSIIASVDMVKLSQDFVVPHIVKCFGLDKLYEFLLVDFPDFFKMLSYISLDNWWSFLVSGVGLTFLLNELTERYKALPQKDSADKPQEKNNNSPKSTKS